MNNIRQIITERLENASLDYRYWLSGVGFDGIIEPDFYKIEGQIEAYQDCLNLMQPRTEADILKDFELLGLVIAKNDDFELILIDDCDRMIAIYKTLKRYDCYYFSEGYKPLQLSTDITMQEHKLLNELFNLWGWL